MAELMVLREQSYYYHFLLSFLNNYIYKYTKQYTEQILINRGTGAGGVKTNFLGKKFEENTNSEKYLLQQGFIKINLIKKPKKYDYYLTKKIRDKTVHFVLQNGLKSYMKYKYNIEIFRHPDEAYIIEYDDGRKIIKILEKKEQNREGSVETKLWSGPSLKREYELVLENKFQVYYGFCVNNFLKNKITSDKKKFVLLNQILAESNIEVLFGDDKNYYEMFDNWLNS